jgi:hypothetical protein
VRGTWQLKLSIIVVNNQKQFIWPSSIQYFTQQDTSVFGLLYLRNSVLFSGTHIQKLGNHAVSSISINTVSRNRILTQQRGMGKSGKWKNVGSGPHSAVFPSAFVGSMWNMIQ